jgi:hypothetical protein
MPHVTIEVDVPQELADFRLPRACRRASNSIETARTEVSC